MARLDKRGHKIRAKFVRDATGKFSKTQGFKKTEPKAAPKKISAKDVKRKRAVTRQRVQAKTAHMGVVGGTSKAEQLDALARTPKGGNIFDTMRKRDELGKEMAKKHRFKQITDAQDAEEAGWIFEANTGLRTSGFRDMEHRDAVDFLNGLFDMVSRYPDGRLVSVEHTDLQGNWMAETAPLDRESARSRSTIRVNRTLRDPFTEGPTDINAEMTRAVDRGFHPPSHLDNPNRAIALHEYGHSLTFASGIRSGDIHGWVMDAYKDDDAAMNFIDRLSKDDGLTFAEKQKLGSIAFRGWLGQNTVGYGMDEEGNPNHYELLATAFADVEMAGEDAMPLHQTLHARMMDHMDKTGMARDTTPPERLETAAISVAPADRGVDAAGNPLENGRVSTADFPNLHYEPSGESVVEPARQISDDDWEDLPVEDLPFGTNLVANEPNLKAKSIDKVVSGREPFREGYITKLFRDDDGRLHVVDGHTRAAMYDRLGKDMPVRIMDRETLDRINAENGKGSATGKLEVPPVVPHDLPAPAQDVPKDYSYDHPISMLTDAKYGPNQLPGKEIPLRHGIGGDSSEAQMANEESKYVGKLTPEQISRARDRAEVLFEESSAKGAPIRDEMRSVTASLGGILEREYENGVPTAVKTKHSTFRKAMLGLHEDGTEPEDFTLSDGVRFTVSFPENEYWESTNNLIAEMEKRGYTTEKVPAGWDVGEYRGANLKFNKDGVAVEVQTHTPYSVYIAEVNHAIYNQTRDPAWKEATPPEVQQQWADLQQQNLEKIPVPRNMPMVVGRKSTEPVFTTGNETEPITVEEGLRRAGRI